MCTKENQSKIKKIEQWLGSIDTRDYDVNDLVEELCNILGVDSQRKIKIEGTVHFSGTIVVPITEKFDVTDLELIVGIYGDDHEFAEDSISIDQLRVV